MAFLRLFGHPVFERGARAQLGVPPKATALLALLTANASRPLSREWLAQTLWPDNDPSDARTNLRRHFHLLGKALGEDVFVLSRHTAQWNAQCAIIVDVIRFDTLLKTQPALAADEYGGDLCAGTTDEVLVGLRVRYRAEYEELLRTLVRNASRAGDDTSLLIWLGRLIAYDPLDEPTVREMIHLRCRGGDRSGAIREYNGLLHRLHSELDVEPQPETLALFSELLTESCSAPAPHNLINAATSFVGRERELSQVITALTQWRIVTITGLGGIGKSRLATRCGFDVIANYPDGVWRIDLEHAHTQAAIWEQLAQAAGTAAPNADGDTVLDHFRDRRALVVLETCEHIHEAAREVSQRLIAQTSVTVLATSRRQLHASGECAIELGALEIPPADVAPGDTPLRYGAYRLFLERAAMISPAFRVSPHQIASLTEVLRSLDGLPLAIELVASRANLLTIDGMRKRLTATMHSSRRTGAPARTQTIEDAILWSYDLLSAGQREVFERLSVFSGHFTPDDIEGVCSDVPSAVESLFELSDASLVAIVSCQDDIRYRLLETIRSFAHGRLVASGSLRSAQLAHAGYYAKRCEALAELSVAEYDDAAGSMWPSMPDCLAALERCTNFGWAALASRLLKGVHRLGLR